MRKKVYGLIAVTTLFLTGCATTRVERDFGNSLKQAKYNQTLNKDAGKNPEPATELDGQAASIIMEEYREGFTAEKRKAKISDLPGDEESGE